MGTIYSMTTVGKEERIITEVTCDFCGKNILLPNNHLSGSSTDLWFGFGSDKDFSIYSLAVCDACFDERLKPFCKIRTEYDKGSEGW